MKYYRFRRIRTTPVMIAAVPVLSAIAVQTLGSELNDGLLWSLVILSGLLFTFGVLNAILLRGCRFDFENADKSERLYFNVWRMWLLLGPANATIYLVIGGCATALVALVTQAFMPFTVARYVLIVAAGLFCLYRVAVHYRRHFLNYFDSEAEFMNHVG